MFFITGTPVDLVIGLLFAVSGLHTCRALGTVARRLDAPGAAIASPMFSKWGRRIAMVALFAATAVAHVGSPDIYLDGKAGPYQLFVTIRPPQVIPGVA